MFGIASASVGVGLVFFAMMGSVFAFTQYMQLAHGFSALEAGAAMLSLALDLVIGSGVSNRLTGLVGRTYVIAGGLVGVAAVGSAYSSDMAGAPGAAREVLLRLPSGRAPATRSTAAGPHPTPTAQPVAP